MTVCPPIPPAASATRNWRLGWCRGGWVILALLTGRLCAGAGDSSKNGQEAEDAGPNYPWADVLSLDFAGAVKNLSDAEAGDDQAQLALALARLNLQPQTAQSIDRGRALLAALSERSTNVDVQAAAAYFLVRADDAFARVPDFDQAAAGYERMARRFPTHFFGEMALVKSMTLNLTVILHGRDPRVVAAEWYPRVAALQDKAIKRGALVTLATVLIEDGRDFKTAEGWLREAEYEAFLRWDFRWRAHLRDIFLALKLEDYDRARALYESFAELYPRSLRLDQLRDLVEGRVRLP